MVAELERDQRTRNESDAHYSFDLSMTATWKNGDSMLVIDGRDSCNELCFANDYRTDIERYNDASAQRRTCNAAPVEFWLPGDMLPR